MKLSLDVIDADLGLRSTMRAGTTKVVNQDMVQG